MEKTKSGRSKRTAIAVALASAIAIPAEGIRYVAYYDPPGVLTVCVGSTNDVEKGKVYSHEECMARLDAEMVEAVHQVERCVPGLPPKTLAAWSDAVFNIGPKIVCDQQRSTAARMLAIGRLEDACRQLPRWDKARVAGVMVSLPGLTKRRHTEMKLCLEGIHEISVQN